MTSPFQWQKIKHFAIKNGLRGESFWLGGTDKAKEGEWTWSDGSKWSMDHWGPGRPHSTRDWNCLRVLISKPNENEEWYDSGCLYNRSSICSIPTMATLNSSTQMVFTSENISTSAAIQVRWVAQPSSEVQRNVRDKEETGAHNRSQRKQSFPTVIPGFKLNWKLVGKTKAAEAIKFWRKKNQQNSNKKDFNVMTIMNLVRESKIKGINEGQIWKTLMKHRWGIGILRTNPCLNENKVADVIFMTVQDLNITYDWNLWIPEEDLRLGAELYLVLKCPPAKLIEAAKLSKLFEFLITKENLNTVVAAIMHNIQPRAGDNIKDFTAINMWYQRLDERYNFSLGSVLLPLLNSKGLAELEMLEPPFMKDVDNTIDAKRSAVIGKIQ